MTICRDPKRQAGSNSEMQELESMVWRLLLPAILAVSSASQLPQTQVPVAELQEQEKIASLTLDLLFSLGFDEEACLNALRGMIRAIDGHGRAESQTAQDNGKVAPATPGTEAKETESTEDTYDENDNKPGIAAEEVLRREYDAQEDSRKLEEAHIMSIGEDDTHWGFDALTVHIRPRPLGRGAATVYGARAATGRHRRLPGRRGQQHTHTPSRRREAHTPHTHTRHTHIHAV